MAGHRFNPQKANKLLNPERKKMLPPETVIETLGIQEGDAAADLGAGNGFLTIPIAHKTKQTVYAVDIEPMMLELLKERAVKEAIHHIDYVVSDLQDIKLENDSVNHAVMAFVAHEIPDLKKALAEIKRILKPGGKFMLIDWAAKEMEMGPPLHERIPSEKMERILNSQGWTVKKVNLNEAIYGFVIQ